MKPEIFILDSEFDLLPSESESPRIPDRTRSVIRPRRNFDTDLKQAIAQARDALLALQHADGHWSFELEADCTIPAEYILMMHFMDEIDVELQNKIAVYLRDHQEPHDGWALYYQGEFDMSCSVKAYYALKLAGDSPDAPHMVKARNAILANGGAARSNVFTRIALAMFEQVPWRATPLTPVEIMLLPSWSPFHLLKVSYWSRTVMVPLTILCSLKAKAKNPNGTHIRELFTVPPEQEKNYFPVRSHLNRTLLMLERIGKFLEPAIPKWLRRRALKQAEQWIIERLNGTDGLGAIFPAMVNAHESLALLGYPKDHPYRVQTKQAIEKLLIIREKDAYCQPCFSPVWDTALSSLALHEATGRTTTPEILQALDWLKQRQLLDEPGDWQQMRPGLRGGGWPFQYGNDHYPDIDDTAAVGWIMHQVHPERYRESIARAAEWVSGMQSTSGGFSSFDIGNTYDYLNEIPFADHGALLDPPTSDVSARCVTFLSILGDSQYEAVRQRCFAFLDQEQEEDGSWFGRWGTNYIYGTWAVLVALEAAGVSKQRADIQRAIAWLKNDQTPDGGWGEGNNTYYHHHKANRNHPSSAFQTAWAMLGLMATGEVDSPEVRAGAEYLMRTQQANGFWNDPGFTAPGFPRVFYLKYHGYDDYFPLWALARYNNLRAGA